VKSLWVYLIIVYYITYSAFTEIIFMGAF